MKWKKANIFHILMVCPLKEVQVSNSDQKNLHTDLTTGLTYPKNIKSITWMQGMDESAMWLQKVVD
jgi:hypothetical protein